MIQQRRVTTTSIIVWLLLFAAVFIWSAIEPKDRLTWLLEVMPAIVGVIVMAITWNSFRLTVLLYWLILIHCIILMIGGHYTYAEVPNVDWLNILFGDGRNNYDKLGHFAQGFIPSMIAREIVIRKKVFSSSAWRNFFIICFCLALSAFYELIEWWVALLSDEAADAFLGTQGYVWDTQSDMFLALIGATVALVVLSGIHDRALRKLG